MIKYNYAIGRMLKIYHDSYHETCNSIRGPYVRDNIEVN